MADRSAAAAGLRATCALLAALAIACVVTPPATRADDEEDAEMTAGGAWHARTVPCTSGIVQAVTPRLTSAADGTTYTQADFASGVTVEMALDKPFAFVAGVPRAAARVVHYQDTAGNALMMRARKGDRVQVCLVSFPVPRSDPRSGQVYCDPDADGRGWVFRVYDMRLRAAFIGPDSQHGCGGA